MSERVKTGHRTFAERRVARKPHRCGKSWWNEGHPIRPGETYLLHTELPGGESGYADAAGHPVRMAECGDCATRYGRGLLLAAPAPPGATGDEETGRG